MVEVTVQRATAGKLAWGAADAVATLAATTETSVGVKATLAAVAGSLQGAAEATAGGAPPACASSSTCQAAAAKGTAVRLRTCHFLR